MFHRSPLARELRETHRMLRLLSKTAGLHGHPKKNFDLFSIDSLYSFDVQMVSSCNVQVPFDR